MERAARSVDLLTLHGNAVTDEYTCRLAQFSSKHAVRNNPLGARRLHVIREAVQWEWDMVGWSLGGISAMTDRLMYFGMLVFSMFRC